MSVTTSQPLNGDQLQAALPPGASFNSSGGRLESTDQKEIVPVGTDDTTLQAAVNTAASQYVDQEANLQTLLQKSATALQNNQAYLSIAQPTSAQAVAQVAALTRQVNGVVRVLTASLNSLAGT